MNTITINPNFPGVLNNASSAGPCGWIVNFYLFALAVAGVLAFGAIVYGGYKYATAAGNASRQSEGRSFIMSSLVGLLLLGGAYVVLFTINPNLTRCSLPEVTVTVPTGSALNGPGGTIGLGAQGNCAGGSCQTLPASVCTQTQQTTGIGAVNCGAAPQMINLVNCLAQKDPAFRVSEGYPPAVPHSNAGHNNGCAIDLNVTGGGNTCASVQTLMIDVTACGGAPFDEYYNAGCAGASNPGTRTGDNVHINALGGGC